MPVEPADVLLNQVDPRGRHVQRRVVGEAERQVFLALAVLRDRLHAGELGDAVGDVDDVVADLKIEERIDRPRRDDLLHAPPHVRSGGTARGGRAARVGREVDWRQAAPSRRLRRRSVPDKPAMQISDRNRHLLAQPRLLALEQLAEPLALALVLAEDRDIVRLGQLRQFGDRLLRFGLESLERLDRQSHDAALRLPPTRLGIAVAALVELAQLQPGELFGVAAGPRSADKCPFTSGRRSR